jgi:hypothetical protein
VANRLKERKIQVSMCQCNWRLIHIHLVTEFIPVFLI